MGQYNQNVPEDLKKYRLEFGNRIREQHLKEGWNYDIDAFETRPYWPLEPKNDVEFYLWAWKEIAPLILESKKVVKVGRGTGSYDRRVMSLCNPGLGERYAATATLFADIQLLGPGEEAPSHRHTPCATRFILEGDSGWTNVTGDRVYLSPGDIVYCGPNFWHDHKNEGTKDFIFLDVLDIPLLQFLGVSEWYFNYEEVSGSSDDIHHPKVTPEGFDKSHEKYIHPWARPRFDVPSRRYNEIQHFPWTDIRTQLMILSEEKGSPTDGIYLQFQNPHTRNPIGPTVDICSQMIRAGEKTSTHRHSWATICTCVEGSAEIVIDGESHQFTQGDIFVIPGWTWHAWQNTNAEPCFIHSISDYSVMERLGFAREQCKNTSITDTGWQNIPFTRIVKD